MCLAGPGGLLEMGRAGHRPWVGPLCPQVGRLLLAGLSVVHSFSRWLGRGADQPCPPGAQRPGAKTDLPWVSQELPTDQRSGSRRKVLEGLILELRLLGRSVWLRALGLVDICSFKGLLSLLGSFPGACRGPWVPQSPAQGASRCFGPAPSVSTHESPSQPHMIPFRSGAPVSWLHAVGTHIRVSTACLMLRSHEGWVCAAAESSGARRPARPLAYLAQSSAW